MRAVVQRVSSASVTVDTEVVASMADGLLALVGVAEGDGASDAEALADKLVHLRVFPDADGKMNRSLLDTSGTLGVVSQFTLLGDCRRGRRPSYGSAADPERAAELIERVCDAAAALGVRVERGRFRAQMCVSLVNEGPVTLLLDTEKKF